MDGWIGFGTGNLKGQKGIPYWFNYSSEEKHISASVEPGGLSFGAHMDKEEWEEWKIKIKKIATEVLGYKIGEPEIGDCDYNFGDQYIE